MTMEIKAMTDATGMLIDSRGALVKADVEVWTDQALETYQGVFYVKHLPNMGKLHIKYGESGKTAFLSIDMANVTQVIVLQPNSAVSLVSTPS